MVKVDWSRKAVKQLLSIDVRYRKSISEKVNKLTNFPTIDLDIKKLKMGNSQYRMRVGNYRIIFQILEGTPVICTIQEVKRRTTATY
ncbi:type II toxin-antitoxin system RelE family toxin [Yersinia massiliensis]|uniref:type II toxin-antitoxin system RelE family toxin n=1 Tax=Yersinia massiliensis TaxID=419257 RepID=UPI00119DB9E4|nr:type II toxin-antitoxin system RelE/ParE family toxin [Yersinia massiliensis]MCB5310111.1 type II toxin-antitoxin system RelE/ParE family toxin [Yersinia massiliensis]